MPNQDISQALQQQVQQAIASKSSLNIVGGNSKVFYGREPVGDVLNVGGHSGLVSYEPTELVATIRAGTPLQELEQALRDKGQMLPFEPPHFGETATVGGTVACNFAGPRRPYAGAVRDHVLGIKMINGQGEIVHFGGEVMKNVAGYDLSRLMAGAMGTLGVLLEVSFKVLPVAQTEVTLYRGCNMGSAIGTMNEWASRPYPISAAVFDGEMLYVRFSGSHSAVAAARKKFGGDELIEADSFWHRIKEHQHGFFKGEAPLWRLSVPPATPPLDLPGKFFIDWGGAQRWYRGEVDARQIHRVAQKASGHAELFRGGDRSQPFASLTAVMMRLHKNLKRELDPNNVFNPGRMYAEL